MQYVVWYGGLHLGLVARARARARARQPGLVARARVRDRVRWLRLGLGLDDYTHLPKWCVCVQQRSVRTCQYCVSPGAVYKASQPDPCVCDMMLWLHQAPREDITTHAAATCISATSSLSPFLSPSLPLVSTPRCPPPHLPSQFVLN